MDDGYRDCRFLVFCHETRILRYGQCLPDRYLFRDMKGHLRELGRWFDLLVNALEVWTERLKERSIIEDLEIVVVDE
jgi:hypothetical protein